MGNIRDRIILIPRYTTYAGASSFTTEPLDVSGYQSGDIRVFTGKIVGPAPGNGAVSVAFQESSDQVNWANCSGSSAGNQTDDMEVRYVPTLTKAWFRMKITLSTGDANEPIVTCFATGFLERRR